MESSVQSEFRPYQGRFPVRSPFLSFALSQRAHADDVPLSTGGTKTPESHLRVATGSNAARSPPSVSPKPDAGDGSGGDDRTNLANELRSWVRSKDAEMRALRDSLQEKDRAIHGLSQTVVTQEMELRRSRRTGVQCNPIISNPHEGTLHEGGAAGGISDRRNPIDHGWSVSRGPCGEDAQVDDIDSALESMADELAALSRVRDGIAAVAERSRIELARYDAERAGEDRIHAVLSEMDRGFVKYGV
jgi:hypothetical protein